MSKWKAFVWKPDTCSSSNSPDLLRDRFHCDIIKWRTEREKKRVSQKKKKKKRRGNAKSLNRFQRNKRLGTIGIFLFFFFLFFFLESDLRIFSFIAQTSLRSFPDDRRAFEIPFAGRFFERGRNTFSLSWLPKIDGLLIDTTRNQVT